MLEKIHTGQFRNLYVTDTFYPDISYFGIKGIHRLQHGCHDFAFANVFFPQCLRQVMVLFIPFGNHLYAGDFDSEIEFVYQSLLTHTLGHSPVHRETELCFDILQLFFYIHFQY